MSETSKPLFTLGDAAGFKRHFAVNFLAAWAAENYDACCMMDKHETLKKPPVEDAQYLAECAWSHWCETMLGQKIENGAPTALKA